MRAIATGIALLVTLAGFGVIGYALLKSGRSGTPVFSDVLNRMAEPLKAFEVDLDPSMSPLRIEYSARVDRRYTGEITSDQHYLYTVTITQDRKPVSRLATRFTLAAEVDASGKKMAPQHFAGASLNWDKVPDAGRYRFEMAPQTGPHHQYAIQNVSVDMRRNVKGVEMKKIWWGIGLILGAALFQFLFGAPLPNSNED